MSWLNLAKEKLFILLLIVLSIPAILPLLQPGFFQSDDGEWMIIRFSAFHQAFSDGQFPVRMLSRLNHEYGYPVANFLYPGFMYLAEVPKILGFGFVDSIKIVLGLSMVMSAVFSYLWLTKLFGRFAAFIGALFYLYAPYHLYDLYKRGSVGEILALAVVPFIFWQLERRSVFFTSIGVSLLILSHNTLALIFLPIVVIYMGLTIFQNRETKQLIYQYTSILVLGLGLSVFFWVPAIFDLHYTRFFQTQVGSWQDHFANIELAGLSIFAILVLSIPFLLFHSDTRKYHSIILFIVVGFLSVFLSLPISSQIWQLLPASFIQFPFRFLSVSLLTTAILSSFIVHQLKGNVKIVTSIALLVLLIFSAAPFGRPAAQFDKGDGYYATNEDSTTVKNEYMPKWVKIMPTERPAKLIELVDGSGEVSTIVATAKEISFTATMEEEGGVVRINKVYLPGWRAKANDREVAISYENDKGVMDVFLPVGSHNVSFVFAETSVRFFSDLISFGSFVLLIVFPRRRL